MARTQNPEEPIRVIVRVRPPQSGRDNLDVDSLAITGDTVQLIRKQRTFSAQFDAALDGKADQRSLFSHIRPACEAALDGINATVLASRADRLR